MKKTLFLFFLLGCVQAAGFAQGSDPSKLFYDGNLAYKNGQYAQAVADYEAVRAAGLESGPLYYNLGNSYFKAGEIGKAVLNYERAKFFIPADSDLKANLNYALGVLEIVRPVSIVDKAMELFFGALSVNAAALFLSAIFLLILIMLKLRLFVPVAKGLASVVAIVLFAVFITGCVYFYQKVVYLNNGGIVVMHKAQIKFEPENNATNYFELGEGDTVAVVEQAPDWYKIKRFDGKLGWVDSRSVALISYKI
jgi:tetratricopeptide (TPR) repeat protein